MSAELDTLESLKSGLVIPAAQSVLTGLISGAAVGAIANLASWQGPGNLALAGGCVLAAVQWYALQGRWQTARNYALYGPPELPEEPTQPEPLPILTPRPEPLRVEVTQENGRQTRFIDLPAEYHQLKALAVGVLAGHGLAVNQWTGAGKPFTRAQFDTFRAALVQAGLARYGERSNSPLELSPAGRAVFRRIAEK